MMTIVCIYTIQGICQILMEKWEIYNSLFRGRLGIYMSLTEEDLERIFAEESGEE